MRFDATENLAALTLAGGHAWVQSGGNKVLSVNTLAISSGGALDLGDNGMVIRNGTIGAWNGIAYTGLTGLIQTGRTDNGTWDGPGVVTSMPDAAGGLTTIGVAQASDVLGLQPGQTGIWEGDVVDATAVIIKYTYAGDAKLDGVIDGGDYGIIDNFAQVPNAFGYFNGDFNYDGVIDGGDYGIIDNNMQAQGAPL